MHVSCAIAKKWNNIFYSKESRVLFQPSSARVAGVNLDYHSFHNLRKGTFSYGISWPLIHLGQQRRLLPIEIGLLLYVEGIQETKYILLANKMGRVESNSVTLSKQCAVYNDDDCRVTSFPFFILHMVVILHTRVVLLLSVNTELNMAVIVHCVASCYAILTHLFIWILIILVHDSPLDRIHCLQTCVIVL